MSHATRSLIGNYFNHKMLSIYSCQRFYNLNVSKYISNLMYDRKKWDELCLKVFLLSLFSEEAKKNDFQRTTPKKQLIQTFRLSFLTTLIQQSIGKILPFHVLLSSRHSLCDCVQERSCICSHNNGTQTLAFVWL